jgi:hypothetical protein
MPATHGAQWPSPAAGGTEESNNFDEDSGFMIRDCMALCEDSGGQGAIWVSTKSIQTARLHAGAIWVSIAELQRWTAQYGPITGGGSSPGAWSINQPNHVSSVTAQTTPAVDTTVGFVENGQTMLHTVMMKLWRDPAAAMPIEAAFDFIPQALKCCPDC